MDRRQFLQGFALMGAAAAWPVTFAQDISTVAVSIDTREPTGPLPHVWEECVGSDRAAITLRESWRHDLDRWRAETGIKRVRFHGIFNDELGVYSASPTVRTPGPPNFQNVDQVYDGLLARGVSPFVELSFMPRRLASADRKFGFYSANVSPPASNEAWAAFVKAFVVHLVERYGLAAVRAWPFEVWNEANLPPFWSGTQQQYFDLYKATALAVKSVDPALQVGGPSTARAQWVPELAAYCAENNAPLDFISTHVYPGDSQDQLFGGSGQFSQADVISEAMRRVRQGMQAANRDAHRMVIRQPRHDRPRDCRLPALLPGHVAVGDERDLRGDLRTGLHTSRRQQRVGHDVPRCRPAFIQHVQVIARAGLGTSGRRRAGPRFPHPEPLNYRIGVESGGGLTAVRYPGPECS